MESRGFVFCFESNEESKSDQRYVDALITCFYGKLPFRPVFMDGKNGYKKRAVGKEIERQKKLLEYDYSEIAVILFVDTDDEIMSLSSQNKKELDDVKKFCADHGYKLVLFVKEIEDVFKVQTDRKHKTKASKNFLLNNRNCDNLKEENLSKSDPVKKGESNILHILDNHLKRK